MSGRPDRGRTGGTSNEAHKMTAPETSGVRSSAPMSGSVLLGRLTCGQRSDRTSIRESRGDRKRVLNPQILFVLSARIQSVTGLIGLLARSRSARGRLAFTDVRLFVESRVSIHFSMDLGDADEKRVSGAQGAQPDDLPISRSLLHSRQLHSLQLLPRRRPKTTQIFKPAFGGFSWEFGAGPPRSDRLSAWPWRPGPLTSPGSPRRSAPMDPRSSNAHGFHACRP